MKLKSGKFCPKCGSENWMGCVVGNLMAGETNPHILKPQDLHLRNLPISVREKTNSNLDGAQEPENTPRTSVRGFLTCKDCGYEGIFPTAKINKISKIQNNIKKINKRRK